ncbi:alpha/beta hydrolase, partial [Pseudomonas fragi]|nr:alpha/beta hydrolase [Pseudomonas sp. GC01]
MSISFKGAAGLACAGLMGWVLSACSPVRIINGLTPTSSFDMTRDIAYGADPRQALDIYRPRQPAPGAPVVIFFYGG